MKFTKIPADTFQKLQINAGILTTDFTPATGTIGEAGQIGATTGGISYTEQRQMKQAPPSRALFHP